LDYLKKIFLKPCTNPILDKGAEITSTTTMENKTKEYSNPVERETLQFDKCT
jgi:hypothetical protein